MAKPTNISLSGNIGGVIFYEMNGKPYARAMPRKFKQTKATKQSALLFGKAVRMGAALRMGLAHVLPDAKDRNMMRRLEVALLHWLRTQRIDKEEPQDPLLEEFEFNNASEIRMRVHVPVTVDWSGRGKAILKIPALDPRLDVSARAHTQSINWKIAVAACSINNPDLIGVLNKSFSMKYESGLLPEQVIELPYKASRGSLVVFAIALRYIISKNGIESEIKEEKWMPAGLLGIHHIV